MYYYDDTGTFYMYRLQTPQESAFHTGTSLVDQSGVSLNHWSQLPSNVIGVAFFDEEDFVIVTSDFNFHILDLDYTVPTGAPREELTSMGPIAFT
ncbi:hypothetical protein FSP39_003145 [Pinctada imbricata]|uniref:Uncharacterized protein n=1 Tax=Pinctada imbricata TaxID=66713 RepID=A0AA89C502_PINIB|nr:hypothetical protein FSP39_003145 [Pinctada imbricata]